MLRQVLAHQCYSVGSDDGQELCSLVFYRIHTALLFWGLVEMLMVEIGDNYYWLGGYSSNIGND